MKRKHFKTIQEFDQWINKNISSGKHWNHGMKGKIHDMSIQDARLYIFKKEESRRRAEEESRRRAEEESRKRAEEESRRRAEEESRRRAEVETRRRAEVETRRRAEEESRRRERSIEEARRQWIKYDNIVFLSPTNGMKCGIGIYTQELVHELQRMLPNRIQIVGLENGIDAKLTIVEHEYGTIPSTPFIKGKVLVYWHSVGTNISETMKKFEFFLDIAGYIVPCNGAMESMVGKTGKDVWVVNLGSKLIFDESNISKEEARKRLGLGENYIGFMFGFQSPCKNYQRLIDAAKNTGIHLVISGAQHFSGYRCNIQNCNNNITFLDKYLTEEETDLWALASDILLFDYPIQDHYSSSASLHRTVGAGRPVICSRINHFNDIEEGRYCLKFNDLNELESCIRRALHERAKWEYASLEYARITSKENIARRHLEIYRHYVEI